MKDNTRRARRKSGKEGLFLENSTNTIKPYTANGREILAHSFTAYIVAAIASFTVTPALTSWPQSQCSGCDKSSVPCVSNLMRVWKCQIKKELTAPKNATRQEGIHRRAFFHRVIVISKLPREASDFPSATVARGKGNPHVLEL